MDSNPLLRFFDGIVAKLGAVGHADEKHDGSTFLTEDGPAPEDEPDFEDEAVPVWTSPEGEIMHARWKGKNAEVWWPLKEGTETVDIQKIDVEGVLCQGGEALYEFFTPALLQFVSPEDFENAARLTAPSRLRVTVLGYQIVSAGFVPAEQAPPAKGVT
jgi:hypothetical protein